MYPLGSAVFVDAIVDVGDDPRDQVPHGGLPAHLHEPLLRGVWQLLSAAGAGVARRPAQAGPALGVGGARGRAARRARRCACGGRAGAALRLQHRRGRPLRAARGRDVRAGHAEPALLRQPARASRICCTTCSRSPTAARGGVVARARRCTPQAVYTLARVAAAVLGTLALWLLYATGARLFGRARRAARGGDRGGRVPAGLLRAPRAQRRAHARAADAVAAGHAPACCAKAARATTCSPASGSAWRAPASTPPGSSLVPLAAAIAARYLDARAARAGRRALAGSRSPARCRARRVPAREPLLAARLRELPRRTRAPVDAVRRSPGQARRAERAAGSSTTCGRSPGGSAGCPRWRRSAARSTRLARASARWAGCSCPRRSLFLAFMGLQGRYFGRWLLPIFPIVCLLAALLRAARCVDLAAARRAMLAARRAAPRVGARSRCSSPRAARPGAPSTASTRASCSRAPTRARSRAPGCSRTSPRGTPIVVEPVVARTNGRANAGPGTPTVDDPFRWNKYPSLCARIAPDGASKRPPREVGIEDYERTLAPALIGFYERHGYCWVVTGSTESGRAFADPRAVPAGDRLLPGARRAGRSRLPRLALRARARPGRVQLRLELRLLPARLRAARPADDGLPAARRALRGAERSARAPAIAQGAPSLGRSHAGRVILAGMPSCTDTDKLHLARAIELARNGAGAVKPNPVVGAVVARDGEVLGEGWHERVRRRARRGQRDRGVRPGRPRAARRCTCRSSRAATRARRRRAPTRSSHAGHQARRRRLRRSDREGLRARARDPARRGRRGGRSPTASWRPARGCSTRRSASTPASGARGCCSSRR